MNKPISTSTIRKFENSIIRLFSPVFALLLLACAILALPGCRRTDVREMTVVMPNLTEADKPRVVEALARYNGIDKSSYHWDFAAKTLTLRYDSMQIAQANVRYAIDEKGIKVDFPKK